MLHKSTLKIEETKLLIIRKHHQRRINYNFCNNIDRGLSKSFSVAIWHEFSTTWFQIEKYIITLCLKMVYNTAGG